MDRIPYELLVAPLADDKPKAEYKCPSCQQIGFSYDIATKLGFKFDEFEHCRVCGLACNNSGKTETSKKNIRRWNKSWIECGSKVLYDMPLEERIHYYNEIYDADYRKQYFILSEEDRINHNLDDRLFTNNDFNLPFVSSDDLEVVVQCDSGEKWSFKYETNKILNLDNKRFIMLLAYYNVILGSDYLAGLPSVRYSFPGLIPDLFTFVGVMKPTCALQDIDGKNYEVSIVNKNK
ncbi:MAG: hypothetical protein MJ166_07440 [Clostridia bacterium]|nr:hypothetical protein [Clostridia bacterium]